MSWYRTDNYFTSKNGRLHIYKTKMKYKGKYKSENWYGRTFVDKKQLTKSSGTKNKKDSEEEVRRSRGSRDSARAVDSAERGIIKCLAKIKDLKNQWILDDET